MIIPFHKACIGEEELSSVAAAIKSGWLTMGPKTLEFENEFRKYIFAGSDIPADNQFSISFNSATAALHLALKAIGLKEGDEVILPTTTFIATAEVVTYFGAKPVLCDVDFDTHNIDTRLIPELITSKTKAIIPVHFGGQMCDMNEIVEIAESHDLKVIEDAAHCLPSSYKGRRVGTIGDITCFSFYATKTLAVGEGGMAVTSNPQYAKTMRINRLHGISRDAWDRYTATGTWYYEVVDNGNKYNTTDIQSALGLVQLSKLERMNLDREKIARVYSDAFAGSSVITPVIRPDRETSWHLYCIKVNNRDELMQRLKDSGISTSLHFIPVHRHPYYAAMYGYNQRHYPVAERVYSMSVSLPVFPDMTEAQAHYVSEKVLAYAK